MMARAPVALRKESVDRNLITKTVVIIRIQSLSARRAWIEIQAILVRVVDLPSLSARRAWIEINIKPQPEDGKEVALRKESVDRNPTG